MDRSKEFKMQTFCQNIFNFMLQITIYILGCHHIAEKCFWKVVSIENGNLILSAKNSGKHEPAPLRLGHNSTVASPCLGLILDLTTVALTTTLA